MCGSARGDGRWAIKEGLAKNVTLGQRPGGGDGVSHGEERSHPKERPVTKAVR